MPAKWLFAKRDIRPPFAGDGVDRVGPLGDPIALSSTVAPHRVVFFSIAWRSPASRRRNPPSSSPSRVASGPGHVRVIDRDRGGALLRAATVLGRDPVLFRISTAARVRLGALERSVEAGTPAANSFTRSRETGDTQPSFPPGQRDRARRVARLIEEDFLEIGALAARAVGHGQPSARNHRVQLAQPRTCSGREVESTSTAEASGVVRGSLAPVPSS